MKPKISHRTIRNPNKRFYASKRCRSCNLCGSFFAHRNLFDRFCEKCRAENELFKFSEWLPDLSDFAESIVEKVAA